MCPYVRGHRRNLANTIEPSVCGGDAALCQITLTSCYYCCCCYCCYPTTHYVLLGHVSLPYDGVFVIATEVTVAAFLATLHSLLDVYCNHMFYQIA